MMESNKLIKHIEFIQHALKLPGMYQIYNVEDLALVIFGAVQYSNRIDSDRYGLSNFHDNLKAFISNHYKKTHKFKDDFDAYRLIRLFCAGDMHSIQIFEQFFYQYLKFISIELPAL